MSVEWFLTNCFIAKGAHFMEQLRWLSQCMKGKKLLFFFAMVLAVCSSALAIIYPFITQQITNDVLSEEALAIGLSAVDVDYLIYLVAIMVATRLLRSVVRFAMTGALENVSQNVQQKVRHDIYENLCKQDTGFYSEFTTGDLMTRLTGDMDLVRHCLAWVSFSVVESISLFIFSLIYLYSVNATLSTILLLIVPIILVTSFMFSRTVYPKYSDLRRKLSHMNSVAQENIAGNKTVRAFVREDFENEKFGQCNADYREANIAANAHWLKFYPVIETCSQSLSIVTLLVSGLFIMQGEMSFGDLAAFSLLTWGLSEPMRQLGVYLNDFQRFLASTNKIMEIYEMQTRIDNPEDGVTKGSSRGCITFDGVTFVYPNTNGKKALNDISFSLTQGQTLGIMGMTGSGKTTIIDALTRMLDVRKGKVLIDGVDVKRWNLQALRSKIGVATQRVMLYSDSVNANIAYSRPDMTEQETGVYAYLAAADFAKGLPDGFETIIGEQGTGLSGGQKQRIALARALAKQPEILILDDTTSAVDLETESLLRENLKNLPYICTKIIIAQRVSAISHADMIIVMDQGEIVQQGTHDELIQQDGFYRDIYELQNVQESV